MEPFVDFGLFELLVLSGLGAVGVRAYRNRWIGGACLLTSVAAPAVLVWIVGRPVERWAATVALGTAIINVSAILRGLRPRDRHASEEGA